MKTGTTTEKKASASNVNGNHRGSAKNLLKNAKGRGAKPSDKKKEGSRVQKTRPAPQPEKFSTTQEAINWLMDANSLPGGAASPKDEKISAAPIYWIGEMRLAELSDACGRELGLDEVQYLVQYDGDEEVQCVITEGMFRPVKYLIVPKILDAVRAEPNKKLMEHEFGPDCWGGAFLKNANFEMIAAAGCVYRDESGLPRQYMSNSPLVVAYEHQGERWPVCKERMTEIIGGRQDRREQVTAMHKVLENRIGSAFQRRPRDREPRRLPRATRDANE